MSDSAPGLAEIVRHFSWDLPWLAVLLGVGFAYLRAVQKAARMPSTSRHSRWRTGAFVAGLIGVAIAALSPIEHYGNQLLWVNFTGFLILTMMAAPLLVAGAPLTLAFRVAGPQGRSRLRALYRSRLVAYLTFPAATWLAFAVVTYAWQFSGLTDDAAANVFVRDLQLATLLVVALLFWHPALAVDPQRWRLPYPLRALYLFVEMTHKGLFGGMFLSMNHPMHDRFVANLPAWGPGPMTDQRISILILWIGGNLIFLVVLVALVVGWVQFEQRNTERTDRRLEKARAAERQRRAAMEQVFHKPV